MNLASWIVLAIILLIVILAMRSIIRAKRRGALCSGCIDGSCAGCHKCADLKEKLKTLD